MWRRRGGAEKGRMKPEGVVVEWGGCVGTLVGPEDNSLEEGEKEFEVRSHRMAFLTAEL